MAPPKTPHWTTIRPLLAVDPVTVAPEVTQFRAELGPAISEFIMNYAVPTHVEGVIKDAIEQLSGPIMAIVRSSNTPGIALEARVDSLDRFFPKLLVSAFILLCSCMSDPS